MLEEVLRLTLHFIKLGLTVVDHHLLGVDVLAQVVEFVAGALILALLLVELQLALFHLGFLRLQFRHFLSCLLLCVGGYLKSFFSSFEHFVALEVVGLTLGVGNNLLGSCCGHAALHHKCNANTNSGGNDGNGDVIQYHLFDNQKNVNKKAHIPMLAAISRKQQGRCGKN